MNSPSTLFEVILRPAAQRALRGADRPVQRRLVNAMADLASDPRPHGVKALKGQHGLLRIRVGDYRVVYEVRDRELVVYVVTLGHRSKVYDRL
jgi:mRNA interferase RelE/StbE